MFYLDLSLHVKGYAHSDCSNNSLAKKNQKRSIVIKVKNFNKKTVIAAQDIGRRIHLACFHPDYARDACCVIPVKLRPAMINQLFFIMKVFPGLFCWNGWPDILFKLAFFYILLYFFSEKIWQCVQFSAPHMSSFSLIVLSG